MINLKYLFSKFILYLQIPSIKNCNIDKTAYVGQRSSITDSSIGRFTYVGRNNNITNVRIGSYCSLGSYVTIGGGIHPIDRMSTSTLFYDKNNCFRNSRFVCENTDEVEQLETVIGNDVWFGDFVYVKAGVAIGDGSVIGAGAVVTKDIPPYAIVAGVPAVILKYRFDQDIIGNLLSMQWWDKPIDVLFSCKKYFSSSLKKDALIKMQQDLSK